MEDAQQRGHLPYVFLLSQKQHEPCGVSDMLYRTVLCKGWLQVLVVSSIAY